MASKYLILPLLLVVLLAGCASTPDPNANPNTGNEQALNTVANNAAAQGDELNDIDSELQELDTLLNDLNSDSEFLDLNEDSFN